MSTPYLSPNQKALKRLLKNKPAVAGMVVIVLAVLIAIFGHVIAPDHTPNADDQVAEIATEAPGFSVQMLYKRKNRPVTQNSILDYIFAGRENAYQLIPVRSYTYEGDKLLATIYTGSTNIKQVDTIHIADMVYPLSVNAPVDKVGNTLKITCIDGTIASTNVDALKKTIDSDLVRQKRYLLGTDRHGRDNLSRVILGVRVSLSIGLVAVLISLIIGITLGATAGYFRGWVDDVVMWIINVFWSIPLLLLVFALMLSLGQGFWQIYLAVGLTMWVEIARIVRGQLLSLREAEFVEAAQALGFNDSRIIIRHILPNIVGPIVVITAANFASAIIIEAGLSFLGIGVQPPTPSWGSMLNEYYSYVGTNKAFLAIVPGIAISVLVLAFNLVGNGLRDALDVKTKM